VKRFWIFDPSAVLRTGFGFSIQRSHSEKVFCLALCAMLLAFSFRVEAQQAGKVPRIGLLVASSPSFYSSRIEAFRQGLRELGYVEGKNISIEYRYAEGKEDRLRELAAELVHLKVDIIVAAASALVAKNATKTIPVVFAAGGDPVASGIVTNYRARVETLPGLLFSLRS
jgi:putative tryptophan/tyrosine transport system substrate-binding protein